MCRTQLVWLGCSQLVVLLITGQSGNGAALQLLLMMLPEHYEALGVSALEAALSEGHADVAATIKTLLIMQGPEQGFAAAALSPEGNPGLAKASLHGAYKGACTRGDIPALQNLMQQAPHGLDDNMQLLLLRVAAGAGWEQAVRMLLREWGGVGPRLEANLKAVCRGAVHAGQLQLLQVRECGVLFLWVGCHVLIRVVLQKAAAPALSSRTSVVVPSAKCKCCVWLLLLCLFFWHVLTVAARTLSVSCSLWQLTGPAVRCCPTSHNQRHWLST